MKTLIFGHRGAKAYFPENTMLSFSKALDMGADGIELDIHYSKDGKLVVFHDFELDRMTGSTGMIFEKTWEELSQLSVTYGEFREPIPTLEMVLEMMAEKQQASDKPLYLNVELKAGSTLYKGIEEAALSLCLKYLPKEQLIFSSFDHFALVTLKVLDSSIQTGVLTTEAMVDPWEYVQKLKADFYHPHYLALNANVLQDYGREGLRCNSYTVNDLAVARQLKGAGVHGIITDIPDQVIMA